jgi:hypothetical protein
MASRVNNLPGLIQNANTIRAMTGQGVNFLNIPRSYYGRLITEDLTACSLNEEEAEAVMKALIDAKLMTTGGIVNLDITDEQIAALGSSLSSSFTTHLAAVTAAVKQARFSNMVKYLGNRLQDSQYLSIVRNQILVDIQGQDILLQIFTGCVLQKAPMDEAPFLELIERVCSQVCDASGAPKPLRPGCGGFGIRNFLTLFLSIEVSKAMAEAEKARVAGDKAAQEKFDCMVDLFTRQLDESNPILTSISDAMTAEADYLEEASRTADPAKKQSCLDSAASYNAEKMTHQGRLQECSERYKAAMVALRKGVTPAKDKVAATGGY